MILELFKKKKNLGNFGRGFMAAVQGQWTEGPHWKQNFQDKNDNWLKLKRKNQNDNEL